jgi:hypothetical protein
VNLSATVSVTVFRKRNQDTGYVIRHARDAIQTPTHIERTNTHERHSGSLQTTMACPGHAFRHHARTHAQVTQRHPTLARSRPPAEPPAVSISTLHLHRSPPPTPCAGCYLFLTSIQFCIRIRNSL